MAEPDAVILHVIYRETMRNIETYSARVAENRDIQAAADFARYVLWSGIPKLLKAYARQGHLKADGHLMVTQAEALLEACQDRWRMNDTSPRLAQTQVQAISEKLDTIAGFLARMSPGGEPSHTLPVGMPVPQGASGASPALSDASQGQPGANVVPFPGASEPAKTQGGMA